MIALETVGFNQFPNLLVSDVMSMTMQAGILEVGANKEDDNRPKAASDGVIHESSDCFGDQFEADAEPADAGDFEMEMTGLEDEAPPEHREVKVLPLPQLDESAQARGREALHEQAGRALLRAMSPPGLPASPQMEAAWARSVSPAWGRSMSPGAGSPAYPPNFAWPSTPEFSPVSGPMDEPMRVPEGGLLDDITLPSAAADAEDCTGDAAVDAKVETQRPQLNLAAHLPEEPSVRDARTENLQLRMMQAQAALAQSRLQQGMLPQGVPYGLFGLPGAPFPMQPTTPSGARTATASPPKAGQLPRQPSPLQAQPSPRQAQSQVEGKDGERRSRRRGTRGNRSSAQDQTGEAILPAPAKDLPEPSTGAPRTTVMLRNMPNNQTRAMLMELLAREGFAGQFDFLYLPMDFVSRASLGYAFINFSTPEAAANFMTAFNGFTKWSVPSRKVCGVSWSGPHQGLAEHIERYRNSPVMHEEVPDTFKPVLFSNGTRVPFPPPTRTLRAPRLRGNPS